MPIYMNYDSLAIKGDVTEDGHKDWIEVQSFQWGVGRGISSPTGASADREASAPSVSEVVVTKRFDSASVPLIREAFAGAPAPAAFDFADVINGEVSQYLKVKLRDVFISGYAAGSGGYRPTESLSLNFTKISSQARGTKGETQDFSYDLAQKGAGKIRSVPVVPPPASAG